MIVAHDLQFAFPGRPPLFDGFSFSVPDGSTTVLLGPSGSGKSTLLRLLGGLLIPQGGEVRLGGRPGVVFQDPRLLPWLTVEENVAFALRSWGIPEGEWAGRMDPLLERVELSAARRLRPAQLSGGMAQRAALVRTLALRPACLLLDEPFAAVDPMLREELQAMLAPLVAGVTTVLVTHDVAEAVVLGARVAVLGGRPVSVREEIPAGEGTRGSPAFQAAERVVRAALQAGRHLQV